LRQQSRLARENPSFTLSASIYLLFAIVQEDGARLFNAGMGSVQCLLLALIGGPGMSALAPLLGDKRTSAGSTKQIYEYTT
jgi:hypothetical protein